MTLYRSKFEITERQNHDQASVSGNNKREKKGNSYRNFECHRM